MLDDGSSMMSTIHSPDEPRDEDRANEKLQYTIKGIERRSVDLMRDAAKQDGMKIGAWVSRRMREAAQASLDGRLPSYSSKFSGGIAADGDSSKQLLEAIESLRSEMESIKENQKMLISGLISGRKD